MIHFTSLSAVIVVSWFGCCQKAWEWALQSYVLFFCEIKGTWLWTSSSFFFFQSRTGFIFVHFKQAAVTFGTLSLYCVWYCLLWSDILFWQCFCVHCAIWQSPPSLIAKQNVLITSLGLKTYIYRHEDQLSISVTSRDMTICRNPEKNGFLGWR